MTYFTKRAKWIGSGENNFRPNVICPATELRRTFTLDKMPKSAECLIVGLGLFTLHINGKKVSRDVLSPAFTAYDKRTLFVRYDVKEYLKEGENVIAIKLGNGFFNQSIVDHWNFYLASWRSLPRALFELFINGESALASDTDWRIRASGSATVYNEMKAGEIYDARLEDGWRECEYCDTGWGFAEIVNPPGGILDEMVMPPIRECEQLCAVDMWKSERGWIFDFGKNISGYTSIRCRAERGTVLTLRHGELLEGRELNMREIDCFMTPNEDFAKNTYVFSGRGIEQWRPEFVYHGFRYVEFVWDKEEEPTLDCLTAHFVHTDLKRRGDFTSSDGLLNWIYDAGIRAFLSNYQGHPLDCPHREKNGWTGDAVISADYAVYNFDMKEAYKKWLKDMIDAQRPSGQIPGIVPSCGWGYNWGSGPAWDAAMFYLPYVLYLETGDAECLDVVYGAQEKYLDYAEEREDARGLVEYGLSDWCPPKRIDESELNLLPNKMSDSCYYHLMLTVMAENARLHGDFEKERKYREKATTLKAKIAEIYAPDDKLTLHGQGGLAFLLNFDIVEGEKAERIAKMLADLVIKDGYVHKVGILGMKALPNALSKYGYTDVAYKMLTRSGYPSYSYWRELGETTLCEVWEENQSRNHHMYSDVVNWLARNVAGLKRCGVAYSEVSFEPYVFAEECHAATRTVTPRGEIGISWTKTKEHFIADITLPDGTAATLTVLGKKIPVSAGSSRIKISLND